MLFNSYIFLLFFLPVTLFGYFLFNKFKLYKFGLIYLTMMSLWFYGYFNYSYLLIICASVLVNFCLARGIRKAEDGYARKTLLLVGVFLNVGCLFYFKYFNFFMDNVNKLFGTDAVLKDILLPLGISFFTFQQLSYVIDNYYDRNMRYGFLEYATFVTFFPQLIAGPIVLHNELIPQFADKNKKLFDWNNFSKGLYRFTLGLAKKVLLADNLSAYVSVGYSSVGNLSRLDAFVCIIYYALQIYFDFSGYCDMALGIGGMFNLTLPENFESPYKATNIERFWDSWHKTLTRFFTKYLYIPLGGNRKGNIRTLINTFIVFFVSGIWHGANWTFILWGSLHGIWMIINKSIGKFFMRIPRILAQIWTFFMTSILWVYFRANSIGEANTIIGKLFVNANTSISNLMTNTTENIVELRLLLRIVPNSAEKAILLALGIGLVIMCMFMDNTKKMVEKFVPNTKNVILIVLLQVWCVLSFSGVTEFLYFNF